MFVATMNFWVFIEEKSLNTYKRDIKATFLNQIVKVLAGPTLLLFIPLYLNSIEQGYWYTFTSLAALSIFADLGFTNIVLQFAAHEFAFLSFDKNGIIIGDENKIVRLASFFLFSLKWLKKIIILAFPVIISGGYIFLLNKETDVEWKEAWLIYSFASALVFSNSVVLSFFEGCNSVRKVQYIRLVICLLTSFSTIVGLYLNLNLYALSLSLVVSGLTGVFLNYYYFNRPIKQLIILSSKCKYDWKPQFMALIWRYGISWCSGYLIFQLFTPLSFKYYGADFAGKVGISIAMWTAGFSIASSWITAILPKINMLIEERRWNELDRLFNKNHYKSIITMLIGGSIFITTYYIFDKQFVIFNRIVDLKSMCILFLCWMLQLIINNIAIYLRAHKKEPMMMVSLVSAFYVSISTYLCAMFLPKEYLFLGFLTSYIYGIPFSIYLLKLERKNHVNTKGVLIND